MKFKSKPNVIEAHKFLGECIEGLYSVGVYGEKLPKEERVAKWWNKLHDTEYEAKYGDWIVCHNKDDIYPIKEEVLYQKYESTLEGG